VRTLKTILSTTTFLLGGATIVSSSAWAYFPGKVEVDSAELKQQPRPDAPTIKTLPKGTAFNATDTPNNGYYYIRTATDLGWIDGASIGKSGDHRQVQQKSPTQRQQPQRRTTRRQRTRVRSPFMVKLHGDYNLFSVSDLNNATHSTSFGNVIGFGGEAFYFFDPLTAVGLRVDTLSQKISATDTSTSVTYNSYDFNLSALAVMVGVERILYEDHDYYISGNGFVGLGSSKLSVNATGTSSSTSFEFSAKPITLLALIEGGWKINPTFSVYGEAGYRLMSSSNVPTTGDVSGTIVPSTVSLSFSGPVIGIGASARF
jgi:hypothetical protein